VYYNCGAYRAAVMRCAMALLQARKAEVPHNRAFPTKQKRQDCVLTKCAVRRS